MSITLEHIEEMRQRMGLEEEDASRDKEIETLDPIKRVGLIVGWYLGDDGWAKEIQDICEGQGIYWTTDPKANGRLE